MPLGTPFHCKPCEKSVSLDDGLGRTVKAFFADLTHLLIHEDRTTFHAPLPGGKLEHALMPGTNVREALPDLVPGLREDMIQAGVPGQERHVGKRHLVANKPLGIARLSGQVTLDDAQNAPDLVGIALDGGRELLMVEVREPAHLAKVRALAAHLEMQPLVAEVALLQPGVRDAVGGGVVLLDQVLVDGARLPKRQARVWVLDGRNTAVWVDVSKGLLLNVVEAERLDLVVETQLLKEEDCLRGCVSNSTRPKGMPSTPTRSS